MRSTWFVLFLAACAPPSSPSFFGPGATPPAGTTPPGGAGAAATPSLFVGSFHDAAGGTLTFEAAGDGRTTGVFVVPDLRIELDGRLDGERLVGRYTTSNGTELGFAARVDGTVLYLELDGDVFTLHRDPAVARAAIEPAAAAPAPTADAAAPLGTAVATGSEIASAIAGWRARAPAGWKVRTERELDSPSRESLVLITYRRGLNLESAVAARRDELTNASSWSAIGAARIGEREAAVADASGASDERGALRWRVVWIQADDGVLEVLGVGLSAEGDATRAQVDAVARTVGFVAPVRAKVELANPCYQFYRTSFGVTVSRTLGLDGKGHAQWGGYVGQLTTYVSPTGAPLGSTSGLWKADPDRGVYGIEGDQLIVHWDDGRISRWAIRWNAGRVGMLVQDGEPYVACS